MNIRTFLLAAAMAFALFVGADIGMTPEDVDRIMATPEYQKAARYYEQEAARSAQ